ncbi:MAG: acetylornithine/succinylornithine family transaminase [Phycisphaerae bacterium]|jgi:predicted acetylornithine/succinylornithine family transaminase|nr:acetylornithine/succinylornithine family transaminase [Phycisphaerae bacterium]
MNTQAAIVEGTGEYIIENYGRLPMAVTRGRGALIWDADGKEYIDLFPGFGAGGVCGHCHPKVVDAVKAQADTLLSHGNLFTNEPQVDLAKRITENAFGGKVFYCHSGAEANEAALKLVRLAAGPGRYKIISFNNCFHGRTMGGLSLTPEGFQKGFEPMLPGSVKVNMGDLDAVAGAIDDETAGVIIEPIQAEGGVNVPSVEFMQGLRKLCDDNDLLLVCDEVWTSPARTGKWFAYQYFGIEPDVMTLAKAVGGGLPVGVCVAGPKHADVLVPGTHGCTMGGNPLCAAAGAAAMKLIEDENLLDRAIHIGQRVADAIVQAGVDCVSEIRGKGALIGMQLEEPRQAKDVMLKCMENGLIICIAKNNVLRLAPALTTDNDVLDKGLDILIDVLKG